MIRRTCLVLLLFASTAMAQSSEKYLPAKSQIFMQIDPHEKNKAAFDKTALGKMLLGDFGKSATALWAYAQEAAEAAAKQQNLPERDIALAKDGLKLVETMLVSGMALGIELNDAFPPNGRAVVVLNKVGDGTPNVSKLLADVLSNQDLRINEDKVGDRAIRSFDLPGGAQAGWWNEAGNLILYVGTGRAVDYAKEIDAGKTGLANHATYKKLAGVADFAIGGRGFVVPSLVRVFETLHPQLPGIADDLGLKSMSPILWVSGYDGLALRTITEYEINGPRKGLLQFIGSKKFTLADLPAMPADLTDFSASSFNFNSFYAGAESVVDAVGKAFFPDQLDTVKEAIKASEGIFGLSLKDDLFASFDDLSVSYNTSADGLFGFGSTQLFKLKNEAKMKKALATIANALPGFVENEGGLKRRMYRGVEIFEYHAATPGNFAVQSVAVHKGFLVFGSFPHAVQGYIMRAQDVLPSWKASEDVTKALAPFPREFTGISVSDPRPKVRMILSSLPTLLTAGNGFHQFLPGLSVFDIDLIPHPDEATLGLFPNISVSTDDGKKIRTDSRGSFP